MGRALDNIADFFYPNCCPCCGTVIPYDRLICDECAAKLATCSFCPKCGRHKCICENSELSYDGCVTVIPYTSVGRDGILELKYRDGFNFAKLLCDPLFKRLSDYGYLDADIITAVPMTIIRRSETGYNQAEYIAKRLSKLSGIPCDFKLIRKRLRSKTQHKLDAEERQTEARSAYYPNPKRNLDGKTVILCDDIITTGSTLSACSEALRSMGCKKIYCAVLAGTVQTEDNNKE